MVLGPDSRDISHDPTDGSNENVLSVGCTRISVGHRVFVKESGVPCKNHFFYFLFPLPNGLFVYI